MRCSVLLEGWGSEAAATGGHTDVLSTREDPHSALWELDGAGALRRRGAVPAGSFGLGASGRQRCFVAGAAGQEGLSQVRLDTGELRRLVVGKVAWVECGGETVLFQRPEGPVTLCDAAGRARWEAAGGGLTSHLAADGVYGAEAEGEAWAAVCRERSTGAVRWRHPLPEVGRYLKVVPWGEAAVLWDAGPRILVDRRSGGHLQTFPGDCTDVSSRGCGDELLVAAAGAGVRAIERSGARASLPAPRACGPERLDVGGDRAGASPPSHRATAREGIAAADRSGDALRTRDALTRGVVAGTEPQERRASTR